MRTPRHVSIALSLGLATLMLARLTTGTAIVRAGASSAVLSTYVEPAAGYGFIDHAIEQARRTIDLSMYELEDPTIENDLAARARAGVEVRVILDSEYGISGVNEPGARILDQGGVHVAWAPGSQIFHAKYLVIDGTTLYVGTGNLTSRYYSSTRDFWIVDRDRADVIAASATFSADSSGAPVRAAHWYASSTPRDTRCSSRTRRWIPPPSNQPWSRQPSEAATSKW